MAFTKETARISGRKSKRGQGKVKTETKEIFTDILDANQDNIQEWLNETARESPSKALELLIKISAFILKIAITRPTKLKAIVMTKRGCSMDISIEGEDSLLILAG